MCSTMMTKTRTTAPGVCIVLLAMLALATAPASATQLAFPGAEGFGAYATGGRGGDVYHVTNLNDSGPGSLRYGVESASGARTVVFEVSGYLSLNSPLIIDKPNITIAGQTAPGGGITLQSHTLVVGNTNNVVVRYLRSRVGDSLTSFEGRDAFEIYNSTDVIFDHLSASWDSDEALSVSGASDRITVQWSIISESLTNHTLPSGESFAQGAGGLIVVGSGGVTFHHNLYAHNRKRNPYISSYAGHDGLVLDFRNNVVYNWGVLAANGGEGLPPSPTPPKTFINFVSNYFKVGPSTDTGHRDEIYYVTENQTDRIYLKGNYLSSHPTWTIDSRQDDMVQGHAWTQVFSPFSVPAVATDTYQTAYNRVLALAGASLWRDAVDTRVVNSVINGTGSLIYSQVEVGGWPVLPSAPAPVDTDRDGIPNVWEYSFGLDPFDAADRNGDFTGDGYTNLEKYLHWLTLGYTLPAPMPGDFNVDGKFTATDIDGLFSYARAGTYHPDYDLTGDSLVNQADVHQWVHVVTGTTFADFNLDRRVNNADANTLRANLGVVTGATWATGDTNGDGRVNNTDANTLRANLGFDGTAATAAALASPLADPVVASFTYNSVTGELRIVPAGESVWAITLRVDGTVLVLDSFTPANWVLNLFPDAVELTDMALGQNALTGDAAILLLRLQAGLDASAFEGVDYFVTSDFNTHAGQVVVMVPEPAAALPLAAAVLLLGRRLRARKDCVYERC